jgi:predicted RNA binding protein YcfA (HicA-like mRNA interferase family)
VSHKDAKQLIARLKAQGFTVRLAKSGHYRVTSRDGRAVTVPQSLSCSRSLANARANLRRWLGAEV